MSTYDTDPRDYALELVENGLVTADHLLLCALKYMSHDDVRGTTRAATPCGRQRYITRRPTA